jgi:quercetin dioxygenase-like cupin family protein
VHTHPTFERVTILSGTFYFATGDKFDTPKAEEYKPGDAFMVPPGMPMYAYTKKGEVIVQIHGTGPWGLSYNNPADDPSKKK